MMWLQFEGRYVLISMLLKGRLLFELGWGHVPSDPQNCSSSKHGSAEHCEKTPRLQTQRIRNPVTGKELAVIPEDNNVHDRHCVATLKGGEVVG